MSKFSYEKLLEALELHDNILHAEKQAIHARDIDTIEDLLKQKDQSLNLVISAKSEVDSHYPPHVQSRINSVLSLQQSNTLNFRKLYIQENSTSSTIEKTNPLFRKAKRAYFN